MRDNHAAANYQRASAGSGSPIGGVVALYDTILRDFRRALAALAAGDVEKRVFELNHALTVIAHLRGVLRHEGAQEAAGRFERFYLITHAMAVVANAHASRKSIEELIDLYTSLRAAWNQADQQTLLQPQQPAAPVGASRPQPLPTPGPACGPSEAPRTHWSA
jgi:flagellar biosynthetic protein FliS